MKGADRLFAGVFATGISYADRARERNGDYMKIAFLPYSTLELEWYEPRDKVPKALRAAIEKDALRMMQAHGKDFAVSAAGQTVKLGTKKTAAQLTREIEEFTGKKIS